MVQLVHLDWIPLPGGDYAPPLDQSLTTCVPPLLQLDAVCVPEHLGPTCGYYPNGAKTYLIVKEYESKAKALFADTNVHITIKGKRHLGAVLGANTFTEEYVSRKVSDWVEEIMRLSEIAITQPHAAYAAFTCGLSSHWTYISRAIPDIQDLLSPLETAIHQHFIPALTGREACSVQLSETS